MGRLQDGFKPNRVGFHPDDTPPIPRRRAITDSAKTRSWTISAVSYVNSNETQCHRSHPHQIYFPASSTRASSLSPKPNGFVTKSI